MISHCLVLSFVTMASSSYSSSNITETAQRITERLKQVEKLQVELKQAHAQLKQSQDYESKVRAEYAAIRFETLESVHETNQLEADYWKFVERHHQLQQESRKLERDTKTDSTSLKEQQWHNLIVNYVAPHQTKCRIFLLSLQDQVSNVQHDQERRQTRLDHLKQATLEMETEQQQWKVLEEKIRSERPQRMAEKDQQQREITALVQDIRRASQEVGTFPHQNNFIRYSYF